MKSSNARLTGKLAVASGIVGLVGAGLLIAALVAPTPAPDSMRRATSLFAWQNAAVVVQAMAMIPVTIGLSRTSLALSGSGTALTMWIGLVGQITLAIFAALLFTGTVSDMLYMAPIGIVGVWLPRINQSFLDSRRATAWMGQLAGFGLLLIGIGFLIYGAFVAPAVFLRPLSNAELDSQSLTTANLSAHVCMAVGTLLGRLVYPVWAIVLGKQLAQSGLD